MKMFDPSGCLDLDSLLTPLTLWVQTFLTIHCRHNYRAVSKYFFTLYFATDKLTIYSIDAREIITVGTINRIIVSIR